ncbi:hypothetical protein [Rhodococcus sp. 1168]|uniref:hypothetical protein n=1 Tax=Rhodococcus sp. 1168 TaxID=2018041 RepID=UPI000A0D2540|nr:hypothetical protein [Rhodococcus sp. 1168]ORI19594.1 hypothetical protein BJI47_07595 [Rhodococcus sp. 1168]
MSFSFVEWYLPSEVIADRGILVGVTTMDTHTLPIYAAGEIAMPYVIDGWDEVITTDRFPSGTRMLGTISSAGCTGDCTRSRRRRYHPTLRLLLDRLNTGPLNNFAKIDCSGAHRN